MHWLWVHAGLSSGNSTFYLWWSGICGDLIYLGLIATAIGAYRKHNCRARWCWRLAHYDLTDPQTGVTERLCWRHHPEKRHRFVSAERIAEMHHRWHAHLGSKPGKG